MNPSVQPTFRLSGGGLVSLRAIAASVLAIFGVRW
jgi:hypothetical protein